MTTRQLMAAVAATVLAAYCLWLGSAQSLVCLVAGAGLAFLAGAGGGHPQGTISPEAVVTDGIKPGENHSSGGGGTGPGPEGRDVALEESGSNRQPEILDVDNCGGSAQIFYQIRRRLESQVQNLDQVQGLVQGASVHLWSGLRRIHFNADAQQTRMNALAERLGPLLARFCYQLEACDMSLTPMVMDAAESGQSAIAAYERMEETRRQLRAVGPQIETLGWIADQTNLVSINAQIEAARLGADGKGFHVIAAEIQQLASRSRQVSQEIGDQLEKATTSAQIAAEACESTIGADVTNMVHTWKQLRVMSQTLRKLKDDNERPLQDAVDNAAQVSQISSASLTHMQFEDISRQILVRSREDLVALRKILSDLATSSQVGAESGASLAVESRLAEYEAAAKHKPGQQSLEPGDIELF